MGAVYLAVHDGPLPRSGVFGLKVGGTGLRVLLGGWPGISISKPNPAEVKGVKVLSNLLLHIYLYVLCRDLTPLCCGVEITLNPLNP